MNDSDSNVDSFQLEMFFGSGQFGLPYWLAIPQKINPDCPPLIAVHGIKRDAKNQARLLGAERAIRGQLVVAPLFEQKHWPRYQQVVCKGRADLALLGLLNELKALGLWQTDRFELCGFSGGAQFSHRFAMLYPQMISSLTVTAAGWYTFPDSSTFPYGLGNTTVGNESWGKKIRSRLNEFVSIPICVTVGSLDIGRDRNLRTVGAIDRQQGTHRIERARRWHLSLVEHAQRLKLDSTSIRLKILRGADHDFTACMKHGLNDEMLLRC